MVLGDLRRLARGASRDGQDWVTAANGVRVASEILTKALGILAAERRHIGKLGVCCVYCLYVCRVSVCCCLCLLRHRIGKLRTAASLQANHGAQVVGLHSHRTVLVTL